MMRLMPVTEQNRELKNKEIIRLVKMNNFSEKLSQNTRTCKFTVYEH